MNHLKFWAPAILAVGIFASGCASKLEETTSDRVPTLTLGAEDLATARMTSLTHGVRVTGSLEPAERVEIKAQLAGQLEQVSVDRGSTVQIGMSLARYDATTFRAQEAEALARLSTTRRDLDAAELLFREGAIAERDFVNARATHDAALAQLTIIRQSLERTTVTSPISGTVSERGIAKGEAVVLGQLLFTVVDITNLELAGRVPADQIGPVAVGQKVSLNVESEPQPLGGIVARIEPVADPKSRQVGVYVRVENHQHQLVGGLFATGTISIEGGLGNQQLVIPISAVFDSSGADYVYVVEDDHLALRRLELGPRDDAGEWVSIKSGLLVGERVVATPSPALADGTLIKVPPASAAAGEKGSHS